MKLDHEAPPELTPEEAKILHSLNRNIQFDFDKTDLKADFKRELERLGSILLKRPQDRVV